MILTTETAVVDQTNPMRDDGVRRIAQRAHGLPSAAQQKVLDRIDELRRAEGIDA